MLETTGSNTLSYYDNSISTVINSITHADLRTEHRHLCVVIDKVQRIAFITTWNNILVKKNNRHLASMLLTLDNANTILTCGKSCGGIFRSITETK
jgi:hypothetical protein